MTAGAEIHDGCLVFRSGNCVKTWKAGCLFRAKTWNEGRLLIFLLMFFCSNNCPKTCFFAKISFSLMFLVCFT